MKAFVMKAIGQVVFMEKPIPHAGPNDAIIKTTRALICTSDSQSSRWSLLANKKTLRLTTGGTISNIGYHGDGDFVHIPRIEWGVGMAEKTIKTGLCPGGSLRMSRLLRVLEMKRVDPTLMTTHTFPFEEIDRAFEIMDKKLDGVLKPLIVF